MKLKIKIAVLSMFIFGTAKAQVTVYNPADPGSLKIGLTINGSPRYSTIDTLTKKKQDRLFGTGLVRMNGFTLSYDNTVYPTSNGTGAVGTWPISITGNSATATNIPWSGITSKPTTLSGYGITDAYPLSSNPSGYLTSSALTPYQLLSNLSTDLTASTSKYPSVNAVNTGLSAKSNDNSVVHLAGTETITGTKTFTQIVTAPLFVTQGGNSSQFVKGDGSVDGSTYLTSSSLTPYQLVSQKGIANGYAPLDGSNKIPLGFLPTGTQIYVGTWNASTNTPTLADGTGTNGQYYIVNVAGTQNLGSGSITYALGDNVIYNGSIWQKVANSGGVTSVNGQTAAVVLTTTDVSEGSNLYYTDARVNTNSNVSANTSARHSSVTIGTANGLSLSGQQISLGNASASTTGALSSTDWNTFNNKIGTETDPTVPSYSKSLTAFSVIKPSTDALYEPIFSKNTAFNKNFGSTSGTVAQGDDGRINNGQTAFGWGNHALAGYVRLSGTETITGTKTFTQIVTAPSFVVQGGTSSQFVKADGSVDGSTYASTSYADAKVQNSLSASTTVAPSATAVNTGLAAKQNLVTLTTVGTGAPTFNQSTGALNIPNYTTPTLVSGRYTPTASSVPSGNTIATSPTMYTRVGDIVTVTGSINITASTSGLLEFEVSVPITAGVTFPNAYDLSGIISSASATLNINGTISASVSSGNKAKVRLNIPSALIEDYKFTFTYIVLDL